MRLDEGFVEGVRARLVGERGPIGPTAVAAAARAEGVVLGQGPMLELVGRLQSELIGLGPLTRLVADSSVTDVLVHGPDQVWVDRGAGLERTNVRFRDEAAVRRLAGRLASVVGRRLDDACPFVDARLPEGVRLHAVLHPLAVDGTCISLRIPSRHVMTLGDWQATGSLHPELVPVLEAVLHARLSFLVSGGTGSGKTTLLATLLGALPATERLVVVEDTLELAPAHPHVVRLEARAANVEGVGAVTVRDLVRQALRMRPDRLVVAEVRGGEVVDLLAALNTGHDGGAGTVHANAAAAVPARLEALALPTGLGRAALHSQLAVALDAVIHVTRATSGQRRVSQVGLTAIDESGRVQVDPAWLVGPNGELQRGPAAGRFAVLIADRLATGPAD